VILRAFLNEKKGAFHKSRLGHTGNIPIEKGQLPKAGESTMLVLRNQEGKATGHELKNC
jgi:hypothetical protein